MIKCMKDISKYRKNALDAYNNGCRIHQGICVDSSGNTMKTWVDSDGYLRSHYKSCVFVIHHLAAYQKFGEEWLYCDKSIVIRHLDSNRTNNSLANIAIGTVSQNQLDIPPERRHQMANQRIKDNGHEKSKIGSRKKATINFNTAQAIRKDYNIGVINADICRKYGVSSALVSSIVANKTYKNPVIGESEEIRIAQHTKSDDTKYSAFTPFENLSTNKKNTIYQYNNGYRIDDGKLINIIKTKKVASGYVNKNGYMFFGARHAPIHFLAAYQKYGNEWLHYNWQVLHIDGDKTNNKLENIKLGTNEENQLDISIDNRRKTGEMFMKSLTLEIRKGIALKQRHLTNDQVINIRKAYKNGLIMSDIARKYGVCRHIVRNIIRGKSYIDVLDDSN